MLKSEEHFLEIVSEVFPNTHAHMFVGRGDDCAVLDCPSSLCMSSDLFLEDVHFRLRYFRPEDVGYKALAVNLSDLAAHGASPLGFNLNLIWPSHLDEEFCRNMLTGMAQLAEEFDLALTGGDLSFGPYLGLAISIWGQSPGRSMLRGRCLPEDVVFVVGDTGLARCGLMLLEESFQIIEKYPFSAGAHLRPWPLVKEGQLLAGQDWAKGLMDVSDGLVRDLPRFLGSGTGVDIDGPLKIHPEVVGYCQAFEADPVLFSLLGGEDYALLGGCRREHWPLIQGTVPSAWKLGQVVEREGIFLEGRKVELKGFDHFEK